MANNPNSKKRLYTYEEKLYVLSLQHVSAVEIAGLMVWSPDKAYKTIRRIKAQGFDLSVPFEPHRYNLDAFLNAFEKTKDKVRYDIKQSMLNLQTERQIEG